MQNNFKGKKSRYENINKQENFQHTLTCTHHATATESFTDSFSVKTMHQEKYG